jgi:hypothetical protein
MLKLLMVLIATFILNSEQDITEPIIVPWNDHCYVAITFTKAYVSYEDLNTGKTIIPRHKQVIYEAAAPVTLVQGDTFDIWMDKVQGIDASFVITSTQQFNVYHGYSGGSTLRRSDQWSTGVENIELKDESYGSFGVPMATAPVAIFAWPLVTSAEPDETTVVPIRISVCHRIEAKG